MLQFYIIKVVQSLVQIDTSANSGNFKTILSPFEPRSSSNPQVSRSLDVVDSSCTVVLKASE